MGVQRCHISVGCGRNEPIDKDQVLFWKRKLSADFEIHFKKNENPSVGKSPTMPDLRLVGSSSPFTVEETIQSETIQFYSEKENSERTADLEISRWKPNEKSVSIGDGPTLPDLRLVDSSSLFAVEETIQSEKIQFYSENQNSDQLILKFAVENRTSSRLVLVMVQRCQFSVHRRRDAPHRHRVPHSTVAPAHWLSTWAAGGMCTSLSVSPAALVLKNGVGTARQRRSGGRSGVSQAWGKLPPSRVRRPIEVGGGRRSWAEHQNVSS